MGIVQAGKVLSRVKPADSDVVRESLQLLLVNISTLLLLSLSEK